MRLSNYLPAKNKASEFIKYRRQTDYGAKFVIAITDLARFLSKRSGASPEVVTGLKSTSSFFRDVRMGIGLIAVVDIFSSTIPNMIVSAEDIYDLGASINKGDFKTNLKADKEYADCQGKREVFSTLLARIAGIWADFCFVMGFAVIRPISFANRFFGPLGENASRTIGRTFGIVMTLSDLGAWIKSGAQCMRNYFYYQRTKNPSKSSTSVDPAWTKFKKDTVPEGISFIEKCGDLTTGISRIFNLPLPKEAVLGINLGVASLGLVRLWITTKAPM